MIKTFSDKHTYEFFVTGKSKRLPADLLKRAMRRFEYVDLKTTERVNTRFQSMINGGFVFALKTAMLTM